MDSKRAKMRLDINSLADMARSRIIYESAMEMVDPVGESGLPLSVEIAQRFQSPEQD